MDNESILNLLLTLYGKLTERGFEFDPKLKDEFDKAIKFLNDDRNSANLLYRELMNLTEGLQNEVRQVMTDATLRVNDLEQRLLNLLLWGKEKELSSLEG